MMKNKFEFFWTKELEREYKSYRKDRKTLKKIRETIHILTEDPFSQLQKTHLVNYLVLVNVGVRE